MKHAKLLLAVLLLLLTSGCAGEPLSGRAVVNTLYLDWNKTGWQAVLVYVTSSASADAGQAKPEALVLSGQGATVADALQDAQSASPLTAFYGQNELLLLGPGAQGKAMYEACVYLSNDSAGRPNMAVFGVQTLAEDWQPASGEDQYALLRQLEQAAGESLYTQRLYRLAGAEAGILPCLEVDCRAGTAVPGDTRLFLGGQCAAVWDREATALAALIEGQVRSVSLEASTGRGPVRYTLELPLLGWEPSLDTLTLNARLSGYLKNLTDSGGLIHTGKQELADEIAAQLEETARRITRQTFGQGQDLLRMGFWLRSRDAAACAELERAGRWYDPDRIEWEVRLRAL